MTDIYQFLADHQIEYERFEHAPVYTLADVKQLANDLPGTETKNLFLRNKTGTRHFLVSVPADKRVDLKKLSVKGDVGSKTIYP